MTLRDERTWSLYCAQDFSSTVSPTLFKFGPTPNLRAVSQINFARLSFMVPPLEGSTIFLCRSSLDSTAMESYGLAELKYAIFSRTGRKTKTLPRLKLFLLMAFKHGLLEGSPFLFQYSSMTRAPLQSSRLGELKYAISPGQDVRLKNKSVRKCKK